MPVMAIYQFDNVTAAEYGEFRDKLPLQSAPPGALVHAFGRAEDRFVTIEVWETRGALDAFLDNILAPTVARMGLPMVRPEIIEVEDFVVTKGVRGREIPIGDMLATA